MNLITPDFGLIFWQTIILLVVLFILKKYAWKPILQAIELRQKNIQKNLLAAEKANDTVKKLEETCKNMMLSAEKERDKIIKIAIETKKDILQKAQEEALQYQKNIISKTKQDIENEKKQALNQTKQDIVALSVQIAEKILMDNLKNDKSQEILIKKMITEK